MTRRPPPSRRRSWLRRLLFLLLALLLLPAALLGGLLWWSLPAGEATLRLPALSAPVTVLMDEHGVPRIRAATEHDAMTALGWLHARDRLFQMEMMRRGVAGRLAELGGPGLLRNDRFVRILGLARRAEEDFAALPEEARAALQAYAAGVNAWIAQRGRFAAPEFIALGTPEPWRPEHSLYWAKLMGIWLSGNWRIELDRARLAGLLTPAQMADLWPEDDTPGRPDAALPAPRGAALPDAGHLARLAAALPRFPAPFTLPDSASNAWALAGFRSVSGAPLLANDPHLGFQAPIMWYLARIDLADGRMLAGATSPGVPYVIIGRNNHLAWGFTTTHSDTQDVFVERLEGEDRYATPDGPQPFTVREEVIAVRGAAPERLLVRETRHGPVVSDLDPAGQPAGQVLAVSMANLAPRDSAAAGMQALNRAAGLEGARAAAALITSPPQNLMAADAGGRIGMFLTGRLPLRAGGDGSLPGPGHDGSADWTGWAEFDSLPHQEDPASGALVNANNRVAPPGSSPFLGRDWFGDWRFRRIGQLLALGERHDAAEMAGIQLDTVSLLAREALPLFRRLPRAEGATGTALGLLQAWDGEAAAGLPQPLIFNAWRRRFGALVLAEASVPEEAWTARPEFIRLLLTSPDAARRWCGGDCGVPALRALAEAVAGLAPALGPDPAMWRWGQRHVARFEHPLLRFAPLLGPLTRLEAVTGGDDETVSRGGMREFGERPFAHVHGSGLRLVADLAETEATLAMIATGQSGHPLSRHWGDLLLPWRDGGMLRLTRDPARPAGRLTLMP